MKFLKYSFKLENFMFNLQKHEKQRQSLYYSYTFYYLIAKAYKLRDWHL